jgi:hypothetical protein
MDNPSIAIPAQVHGFVRFHVGTVQVLEGITGRQLSDHKVVDKVQKGDMRNMTQVLGWCGSTIDGSTKESQDNGDTNANALPFGVGILAEGKPVNHTSITTHSIHKLRHEVKKGK